MASPPQFHRDDAIAPTVSRPWQAQRTPRQNSNVHTLYSTATMLLGGFSSMVMTVDIMVIDIMVIDTMANYPQQHGQRRQQRQQHDDYKINGNNIQHHHRIVQQTPAPSPNNNCNAAAIIPCCPTLPSAPRHWEPRPISTTHPAARMLMPTEFGLPTHQ
mmetsp:Transcript_29796/g.64174  ORF Transcript_29796/g.64174 Transcript_29796/m.64174 type:complete len:159 (+) Transcript_29796:244-720(+)